MLYIYALIYYINIYIINILSASNGHFTYSRAHGKIFSKSYQIKPKSDCIYHFSIRFTIFQSVHGKYNLILTWFNKISKMFFRVWSNYNNHGGHNSRHQEGLIECPLEALRSGKTSIDDFPLNDYQNLYPSINFILVYIFLYRVYFFIFYFYLYKFYFLYFYLWILCSTVVKHKIHR